MADVVKYVGLSTVRRVTKKAWEAAGVKGQETVVWDRSNGYSVPLERLSDAAVEVLQRDKKFLMPESVTGNKATPAKKSAGSSS